MDRCVVCGDEVFYGTPADDERSDDLVLYHEATGMDHEPVHPDDVADVERITLYRVTWKHDSVSNRGVATKVERRHFDDRETADHFKTHVVMAMDPEWCRVEPVGALLASDGSVEIDRQGRTDVTLEETLFDMDGIAGGPWDGYRLRGQDGRVELWNGFAVPYFTREQADAFVRTATLLGDDDPQIRYSEARDAYLVRLDGDDEDEVFEAVVIDGKKHYSIGGWSWCWSEADLPHGSCPKCGSAHDPYDVCFPAG